MRSQTSWTCSRCLLAQSKRVIKISKPEAPARTFTSLSPLWADENNARNEGGEKEAQVRMERGPMSQRLADMAEEAMESGGRSSREVMEDAGFSEELKKQLEERIAESAFRSSNQRALSQVDMPSSAGKGTRDQAAAQPWTGSENLHDAALRMLDDSHKHLRPPSIRAPRIPQPTCLRPPAKKSATTGQRLANARDRTSIYALSQKNGMTDEEREKVRRELKERFTPGARATPVTLQGLTSLANERIEDAIARGQFKNILRGKGKNVERDYNASSPFLDTTEYFMNKIIQKQEIVPPWIEKQQELVKNVSNFRSRLRSDWRRHAARVIASKGGGLDAQIKRAQAFALAEEKINPKQAQMTRLSEIDGQGNLATVTVQENPTVSSTSDTTASGEELSSTITVTQTLAEDAPANPAPAAEASTPSTTSSPILPMAYPFRDPDWEKTESAYHTLAIQNLNNLTRSYNLMAPKIAQKPYYSLARELKRCFADVAPQLADEIAHRARARVVKVEIIGDKEGGIMEKFGSGHVARVRDEDSRKGYGFKEFWRDLFRKEEGVKA